MSTAEGPPAEAPSPEAARAALDQVLASATFARSPKLRAFLSYIGTLALRGEGDRINEALIGAEVFGKDVTVAGDDATVRRQAHALRAKLVQHYASDGQSDPVVIDLPVGGYVPRFRTRPVTAGTAPPKVGSTRRWLLGAAGAGLAAGGFLAGRLSGGRARRAADPALDLIWGAWLAEDSVTLCFSNPLTTMVRHLDEAAARVRGGVAVEPGSELDQRIRSRLSLPAEGRLQLAPDDGQGKLGEAQGALRLGTFFVSRGLNVRSIQSRQLGWDHLRRSNLIVFGHPEINPWSERLLASAPLRLQPGDAQGWRRIVDTRSPAGKVRYHNVRGDDQHPDAHHALISFLPGIAPRRQLLLVSGLSSPATDLAAEWLTDPTAARGLVAALEKAASGRTRPGHFQVVLRAEVRQDVPMRGEIVDLVLL